jgi:CRP-like cAMP-binding protein
MADRPSRAELKRNLRALAARLESRPTDLDMRMRLARTLHLMGDVDKAATNYLAVARYVALAGRTERAMDVLRELLQMSPQHVEAQRFMAKLGARTDVPAASDPHKQAFAQKDSGTFATFPDGFPADSDSVRNTIKPLDVPAPSAPLQAAGDEHVIDESQIEGEWSASDVGAGSDGAVDAVQIPTAEERLLPQVPLFAALPRTALAHLRHAMVYSSADAGDVLFREGDDSDSILVIAAGRAVVTRHIEEREIAVQELGPLDVAGLFGLHEHRPRQATLRARSQVEYVEIDRMALLDLFDKHPSSKALVEAAFEKRLLRSAAAGLLGDVPERTEAIAALVERLQIRTYEEGDDLLFTGMDHDGLWILLSGSVGMGQTRDDGTVEPEALLRVGDYVGSLAVRHGHEVDVGAVAQSTVRVAMVGHRLLGELCDREQARGEALLLDQSLRVSEHVFIGNVLAMRRVTLAASPTT